MTVDPIDQVGALARLILETVLVFPDKRPLDTLTLSHVNAAERVHRIAAWLGRGSDLTVVMERTPFTAQSAADLRAYYDGLPLEKRLDIIAASWVLVELLEAGEVLPRSHFPRLRRVLDLYLGVVGLACLCPRRVFYHIHYTCWVVERNVLRQAPGRLPETPLLLDALAPSLRALCDNFGSWAKDSAASSAGWMDWLFGSSGGRKVMVLVAAMGVGAVALYMAKLPSKTEARQETFCPPSPSPFDPVKGALMPCPAVHPDSRRALPPVLMGP